MAELTLAADPIEAGRASDSTSGTSIASWEDTAAREQLGPSGVSMKIASSAHLRGEDL